ncbi:MAG: toll/interleukin-1 receptor domain-containing protein [Planctomycetota bacterium]|jgi:hypothetical protein
MSAVFISHSHVDKPIARRVARRLGAHGVETWLDEHELRPGDTLGAAIEQQIQTSTTVVVIATLAATKSKWVNKELAFAGNLEPPKPICPLFVEDVKTHDLFADHLGIDATDRCQFEHVVLMLTKELAGVPLPMPSQERIRDGLHALEAEEPSVSLLIDDCLDGKGLAVSHLETVEQISFYSLDYALNALYDLASDAQEHRVAHAAADLFARKGVGAYTIERHVAAGREPDAVLHNAVSIKKLDPRALDTALHLLSVCSPPDDQALAGFIRKNADHEMTNAQRNSLVHLVTCPERGPGGFTFEAAFEALNYLPESEDLKQCWQWWIKDGLFDGCVENASRPADLAYCLGKAGKLGLSGWDAVIDTFLMHVKALARSTDRTKVRAAVMHLIAAADRDSPLLPRVSHQCNSALGAAEWDNWPHEQEMGIYVNSFVKEAHGDRNWAHALKDYRETWAAVQQLNELRERSAD